MYMYIHTYNKEIEKEVDLVFLLVWVGLLDHFFPDDFGEVDRETIAAITAHVRERDHGALRHMSETQTIAAITTHVRENSCHYDTCQRERPWCITTHVRDTDDSCHYDTCPRE